MHQRGILPAALGCILLATLWPLGTAPPRFDLRFGLSDALANIALFLPLGLVAGAKRWKPRRGLAVALLLSACLELLQGNFIPGRVGSPFDVAANVTGALAGMLWWRAPLLVLPIPVLGWLTSGYLLHPAIPDTPRWWGQWAHQFAGTTPFQGRVLGVRLLGRPAIDGALDSTQLLVSSARSQGFELEASLLAGGITQGRTHLAGVSDGEGNVIIAFEQTGADLRIAWQSYGASAGLRAPVLLFPDLLRASRGTPITIRASIRSAEITVDLEQPVGSLHESHRLSPFDGWRNLVAMSTTAVQASMMTLLWTGGLGFCLVLAGLGVRARGRAPS